MVWSTCNRSASYILGNNGVYLRKLLILGDHFEGTYLVATQFRRQRQHEVIEKNNGLCHQLPLFFTIRMVYIMLNLSG